jgi:hypothetical protein
LSPDNKSGGACPLCTIVGRERVERVFTLNSDEATKKTRVKFFVVATKNKKGHEHRYMVVLNDHVASIDPETEADAVAEFFKFMRRYGVDFAIMESTYATINDHWHRVGTDLNPRADDAEQIRDTERFEVVFKRARTGKPS